MTNAGITRIFHANIICSNIDRSIKWYTEVLGATLVDGPFEGEGANLRGIAFGLEDQGVDPEDVKIKFALIGWGENNAYIDLIESVNPAPFGTVPTSVLHMGLARICLSTDSVQRSYDALLGRGVEFLTDIVDFEATEGPLVNHACVCFRDPDGTVLELYGPR